MPSPSVKRRRRAKHADEGGDPEFQVAPMVDVLLVLLLFFMSITSTELLKKERNLHLAEADKAKKDDDNKQKQHEIVINVAWDGIKSAAAYTMDGITYPGADAFTSVLAGRVAQDKLAYVLIRSDKDTQYSNISDLMHACAAGGIATVSFAVIAGAKTKPPAGGSAGTTSN